MSSTLAEPMIYDMKSFGRQNCTVFWMCRHAGAVDEACRSASDRDSDDNVSERVAGTRKDRVVLARLLPRR